MGKYMTTEYLNVPVWLWMIGLLCVVFIWQANHFLGKMREISRARELEEWHSSLHRLEINQILEVQFLRERVRDEYGEQVAALRHQIETKAHIYDVAGLELMLAAIQDKVNDQHKRLLHKHNLQHNDLRAKHYRVLGHGL